MTNAIKISSTNRVYRKKDYHFQLGNHKLPKTTAIFNLPRLKTCPGATELCKKFCYAGKAEKIYPQVPAYRERKYQLSLSSSFVNEISSELEHLGPKIDAIRIHESGDFYDQEYLNKWVEIANKFSGLKFYAYTKSYFLDFSSKPSNMIVRLSLDGTSNSIAQSAVALFDGVAWMNGSKDKEKEYFTCPGSCKTCTYCLEKGDVQFGRH